MSSSSDTGPQRFLMPTAGARASAATSQGDELNVLIGNALGAATGGMWLSVASDEPELRAALAKVCAEAHRRELRAEKLLVLLKEEWRKQPATRVVTGVDVELLLSNVVTLCIEEYYRSATRS